MTCSTRPFCLVASLLFAASNIPLLQAQRQWSHGDPSAREQHALEVINSIRADPVGAVARYGRVEMQRRDPMVAAALREVSAPVYSDGFIGRDLAHAQMTPTGYVHGVEAAEALMRSRVREMERSRDANDQTVAPLAGATPPLPPLVLYPLFSQLARSKADEATASEGFATARSYFWSDSHRAQLPATAVTPPIYIHTEAVPFRALAASGPNATGGIATLKPGIPPVGNSLAHYARGQQLYLQGLYDDRITLAHAVLTPNFQPDEFLKNRFTWTADQAARRTYGSSQMLGLSVSEPRIEAPGAGTRTLAMFRSDDDAIESSDLPYGAQTVFLTGAIYVDRDYDGAYSINEGAGSIRVESQGDWFAVTSSSGGYAIPIRAGTGAVTVTATGVNPTDGQAFLASRTVTVADRSVKIDFTVPIGVPRVAQRTIDPSTGDTRLANLSTRGVAEAGNGALMAGFSIVGSGQKKLLIRGMTASLLPLGVTGVLRKPLLTLVDGRGEPIRVTRTQDTYHLDRFGSVAIKPELVAASLEAGAFPFSVLSPPYPGTTPGRLMKAGESYYADAFDVATVMELSPGTYSVVITPDADSFTDSGISNGLGSIPEREVRENPDRFPNHHRLTWGDSGVCILEIYDLTALGGRIVNLSTRGRVEPGARALIVGFSVAGTGSRRILVRGVSPGLRAFGLADVLDDVAMAVISGAATIDSNDNWAGSPYSDQIATLAAIVGAFPLSASSPDAATLMRLPPGPYSVQLSAQAGAPAGTALAEVYVVDP